jgi:hypothetical protein
MKLVLGLTIALTVENFWQARAEYEAAFNEILETQKRQKEAAETSDAERKCLLQVLYESCPLSISHVPYLSVMSPIYQSCPYQSCPLSMSHVSYL